MNLQNYRQIFVSRRPNYDDVIPLLFNSVALSHLKETAFYGGKHL